MDIFDLSVEEFEKKIDEILENISEEELLEKLILNGLEVDIYENEERNYYMENLNNVWIHNNGTCKENLIESIFNRNKKKKQNIDLMEAA